MTTTNNNTLYDANAEAEKVIKSLGKAQIAFYEQQVIDTFPRALGSAVEHLLTSAYRYLVASYPIKANEHIPPLVVKRLKEREAPACFTGDYVCISSEQFAKMFVPGLVYSCLLHIHGAPSEGWSEYLDRHTRSSTFVSDAITSILAHEYTHALCGHAEHIKAHMRKFKDQWTFTAACEIQANRGMLVQSSPVVYDLGVSDAVFPETKNCYSLEAIYKALRDKHGNKIDQPTGGDKTEQNPQSQNANQSANNNGNSSNDEQKSQSQNANQSANNNGNSSNDEQKSQSQNANQSANNGDGSSSADNKANNNSNSNSGSNSDHAGNDVTARQQQAVERMKKQNTLDDSTQQQATGTDHSKTPLTRNASPSEATPGEPRETAHKLYDYDPNTGMNVPRPDTVVNPEVLLRDYNDEYKKRQIRKSLRNLRSVIKGDMSKTKTKTYSRPPRRSQNPGNPLLRKGTKRDTRSVPKVLVALDQSGSMSNVKVKQVAEAISAIVDEIGRTTKGSYICRHDNSCHRAVPLKDWRDEVQRYDADGCNDFSAVYELAQKLDVDVVLNVGDGGDTVYKSSISPDSYISKGKQLIWYDLLVDEDLVNNNEAWYWREVAYDVKRSQGQFIRRPIALVGALASKNWNEAEALYGDNI